MLKLYRFNWDCGRQSTVHGIFVADHEQVEQAMGKRVNFGEILGKHSDVHGTLDPGDLEMLTDDAAFIDKFTAYGCESGYNPLHYMGE